MAVLRVPRPDEGTNIAGACGLTEAQRASMLALSAVVWSSSEGVWPAGVAMIQVMEMMKVM